MAVLKRTILICNKCKAEVSSASPNVAILGEDFYLCDTCLDALLYWMEQVPPTIEITEPSLCYDPHTAASEESIKKYPNGKFCSTYMKWDEYKINQLMYLRAEGLSAPDIAKELGTTKHAISNLIHRIRNSNPGSELHKYKSRLEETDNGSN